MLILRRRVGEAIQLDGPGRVTLLKVDGRNRAVWGIEAPQSTRILRSELQEREQVGSPLQHSVDRPAA